MYTFTSLANIKAARHKACKPKKEYVRIQEELESGSRAAIKSTLNKISKVKLSQKEESHILLSLINLIVESDVEILSIVYSLINRIVSKDASLLLLATNTVLKEFKREEERRVLAAEFLARTVEDLEFFSHFEEAVVEGIRSGPPRVQRVSLLVLPVLHRLFKDTDYRALVEICLGSSDVGVSSTAYAVFLELLGSSLGSSLSSSWTGSGSRETVVRLFKWLITNRHLVAEVADFSLLFTKTLRALAASPPLLRADGPPEEAGAGAAASAPLTGAHSTSTALIELVVPVLPYLKLHSIQQFVKSVEVTSSLLSLILPYLTSLTTLDSTPHLKGEALALVAELMEREAGKKDWAAVHTHLFYLTPSDSPAEKRLKLKILASLASKEAVDEIILSLTDRDCIPTAVRALLLLNTLKPEHIEKSFSACLNTTLLSLYHEYPLDSKYHSTINTLLSRVYNVREKVPYLYLLGYVSDRITNEARRISRIKKAGAKSRNIVYGDKEERSRAEEHLEEYLYFLINLFLRGVLEEDKVVEEGDSVFESHPYLKKKLEYLLGAAKESGGQGEGVRGVVAYKRRVGKPRP